MTYPDGRPVFAPMTASDWLVIVVILGTLVWCFSPAWIPWLRRHFEGRDRGQVTGELLLVTLAAALAWFVGAEVWAGVKWLGVHGWALVKRIPH